MITGMTNVSQVDWCLTSSTAGSLLPWGRFSMPWMRFWMPNIQVPLFTAKRSQAAQISRSAGESAHTPTHAPMNRHPQETRP